MKLKKHLALVAALALTMVSGLSAQTGVSTRVGNGVEVGEPVTPVEINVDLRNLPTVQDWRPGQPIKEAQRRVYRPLDVRAPHAPSDWVTAPDRLGELQATFDSLGASRNESTSRVSINNGSTGVSPGDPVVEVNANYVMYGINGSTGTTFTVYNKTGTKLAGPTAFKTLAPAGDPCATSVSDPIIHWDRLANRWFMLEMGGTSSANRLCVYVSKTDNPVSGGWWFYGFATPDVPDYPHCSVWHNAYVCTTNEGSAGAKVYAFDRANMLTGATARAAQRFTSVAKLTGYGFQALTPATFMGTATNAPPAGSAVILARHNDDEAHAGTGANTTADFIDLYALNINWTTPASSNITTLPRIQITEFNSWFRDYSSFATVPQPGSTSLLDPIREVILNSMTYRNMGSYESIVGNFATNQNAARSGTVVDAGIRWFELRRVGAGNWTLQQEGTFSPGDSSTHHLLGALATDKMGNIGMSYNVTKTTATTVSASLKYTGRLVTDANGVMSQGENTIAAGSAAETSGRWGDYHQTVVDPADDCTFWTVGMYRPAGSWNTSIRDFKFSNCGGTPPVYYSISGQVTTSTGVGISGVTVSTGSASAATDASGNYTIANLVAGSYTITPSASGYTFSPVNRAVTIGSANVTGQNFTGTAAAVTYSISGTVATSGSVGISGVTVSTGSASATTNASGAYTISGLANGSYTLTPSLAGYTFSPTSLAATVSGANLTGRNFTGTAATGGATALSNGVGAAGSTASTSANSSWKDYTVAIPAGATNLTIATSGASGDVDLYVKAGAQATLTVYDCRPYTGTGNESCPFATPTAGTYYVRVYGYATGTVNFTVTASWTVGGGGGGTVVERMVNGNFDAITTSGNTGTGWARSAYTGTSFNTLLAGQTNANTGGSYAYLGVNATTSSQTVNSNAVLIPAGATTATLSFFTSIVTSETSTTSAYDKLQVQLIDAGTNAVITTLVTLSNVNKTTSASTYVQRSYNVAAYKGRNV
ncbi:MAG TPA: pre-peptidase C-terminal domain-containing protein, partial [Xanthomonadales bacterium]|nr:pre-peptidase C-terminal domain-containing protein [Xanthomonadales bacterium]